MAGIDDVLERLITDPAFKANLAADPRAALAGYQLSANDLSLLAQQVSSDDGGQSAVEQRTSKAGFFALFSQFSGGPGGPGGGGSEVSIQDVSERPAASDVSDPDLRGVSDPDQRGIGGPDTMPGADRGIIINGLEQSGPSGAGSEVSVQDVSERPGPGGTAEVSVQDVSERPAEFGGGQG